MTVLLVFACGRQSLNFLQYLAACAAMLAEIGFASRLFFEMSFEMLEDQLHDQVGCLRSFPDDQNAEEPLPPPSLYRTVVCGLPCILFIGGGSWASTRLDHGVGFKHLERNLAKQAVQKPHVD